MSLMRCKRLERFEAGFARQRRPTLTLATTSMGGPTGLTTGCGATALVATLTPS
jgi:hypothetical protein